MSLPPPRWIFLAATLLPLVVSTSAEAQERSGREAFEALLQQGKLAEAEEVVVADLKARPEDDEARFALGVVRFLRAVEARMQAFYRHGFGSRAGMGLMTNLPVPKNPNPEPLDYKTARAVLQTWINDLARVESTLSKIKSPDVKMSLHFALIRLDFDGDGKVEDEETLWNIYRNFNRAADPGVGGLKKFVIVFDRGDVDWLRGYCHVLTALAEVLLAHDFEEFFNGWSHLVFQANKAPEKFLEEKSQQAAGMDMGEIFDVVSVIHMMRFSVVEPERMKAALGHLEAMSALSRTTWKFILAETDNDHEWLPNPKQTSAFGVSVTAEMIHGWNDFLAEFDAILAGKKLLPFWRGAPGSLRGINLRKVFTEPRTFDLVLWIDGLGVRSFVQQATQKDELSSPETWNRLNRIFGGEFIGFAIWFN